MKKEDYNFESFTIHTAIYQTLLTEKYLKRKPYKIIPENQIMSKIPGSIYKIHAMDNQEVAKGDVILELEAMKMYNKILAPVDGKIKKIYVREGDKIPKDFLMIEFE